MNVYDLYTSGIGCVEGGATPDWLPGQPAAPCRVSSRWDSAARLGRRALRLATSGCAASVGPQSRSGGSQSDSQSPPRLLVSSADREDLRAVLVTCAAYAICRVLCIAVCIAPICTRKDCQHSRENVCILYCAAPSMLIFLHSTGLLTEGLPQAPTVNSSSDCPDRSVILKVTCRVCLLAARDIGVEHITEQVFLVILM